MKIGQTELGKTVITVGSLTGNIREHQNLKKIDVFELRLDLFKNQEIKDILHVINFLKINFGKPLIATIRAKSEGGSLKIDDDKRYQIFENVIPLVDAIDVELSSPALVQKLLPLCKKNSTKLICSYHNFETTPALSEMDEIVLKSKALEADIIKIAVKANSKEDLSSLMEFTIRNKSASLITVSLGSIGLISRLVNPFLGSLMTYGYVDRSTALGQISIFDIIDELRFYDPEYNQKLIDSLELLESI